MRQYVEGTKEAHQLLDPLSSAGEIMIVPHLRRVRAVGLRSKRDPPQAVCIVSLQDMVDQRVAIPSRSPVALVY